MDVAVIMQGAERLGEAYGVTMPYAVKLKSAMDGRFEPLSGGEGSRLVQRMTRSVFLTFIGEVCIYNTLGRSFI
jgi:hypothetical protein